VFVNVGNLYPSTLARLEPTRVEPLMRVHTNGRFLALPANIRQVWK
jgi:hypothetical protein